MEHNGTYGNISFMQGRMNHKFTAGIYVDPYLVEHLQPLFSYIPTSTTKWCHRRECRHQAPAGICTHHSLLFPEATFSQFSFYSLWCINMHMQVKMPHLTTVEFWKVQVSDIEGIDSEKNPSHLKSATCLQLYFMHLTYLCNSCTSHVKKFISVYHHLKRSFKMQTEKTQKTLFIQVHLKKTKFQLQHYKTEYRLNHFNVFAPDFQHPNHIKK